MNSRPVVKLRSLNMAGSKIGSRAVSMWTVNIQAPAMAIPHSIQISQLANQSRCSPRSSISCRPPSASAISAKPNKSKRRVDFGVAGMKRSISASASAPTGRLIRNTQRQL